MKRFTLCLAIGFSIGCLASAASFAPNDSFDQSLARKTPVVKVYAAPTPMQVKMEWESMSESLSLVPMALKFGVMSEAPSADPVDQPEETLFFSPDVPSEAESAILQSAAPSLVSDFVAMIGMLLPESELLAEIRMKDEERTASDRQSPAASSPMVALARFSR